MSGSAAWATALAVGVPAYLAVGAAGIAALTASLPDIDQKVKWLPHRGPTHWPALQAIAFSLPVIVAAIWLPVALVVVMALAGAAWFGCFIHSCADAMTIHPSGIKLLWPISRRGFHLLPRAMRVRVGRKSGSEWVFATFWLVIVLCFTYARFHHLIIV